MAVNRQAYDSQVKPAIKVAKPWSYFLQTLVSFLWMGAFVTPQLALGQEIHLSTTAPKRPLPQPLSQTWERGEAARRSESSSDSPSSKLGGKGLGDGGHAWPSSDDAVPTISQSVPADEADRRFQLGILYFQRNQLDKAETHWEQALTLYRQRQDALGELKSLEGLGLVYQRRNQLALAQPTFEAALALAQRLEDRPRQANALGNLGNLHQSQGRYGQANQQYEQALALYRELGDRRREGLLLTNLANLQGAIGQYNAAKRLFTQSLEIAEQAGDVLGKLSGLNSLGLVQASQGRYVQAENAYYNALRLARNLPEQQSVPLTEATLLYNLGSLDHAQGRFAKAEGYYRQGLEVAPSTAAITPTLESNVALIQAEQGETDSAIARLNHSIEQLKATGNLVQVAIQQGNLGYVHWRAGQLAQAEQALRAAISQREAIRAELDSAANPTENRSSGQADLDQISLFDTQIHPYNLLQQVLVAQNKPEQALLVAEQGRARAFAALVARQFGDSARQAGLEAVPSLEELRELARSRQATLVEYAVIPDETFIAQGKQRGEAKAIYIWVIQPSGEIHFRNVDLAPLQAEGITLAQLVQAARCFESAMVCNRRQQRMTRGGSIDATTTNLTGADSTTTSAPASRFQFQDPSASPGSSAPSTPSYPTLQRFHQLLIEPIVSLLPSSPSAPVVIIPHDALFLLPFSALQNSDNEFLVERHALTSAPSLQVLQLMPTPRIPQRWDGGLFVGNPTMPTPRNATGKATQALLPLPGSEREVKAIAKQLQVKPWLGGVATEQAVTQQLLQANWIHLATHGLLDYGAVPQPNFWTQATGERAVSHSGGSIPGAMALAPNPDHLDDPSQDGLLTSNEILQLKIQAELVVLSACDTGRGEITGDGVVGLSRAWLGAGAKGVLVSLWAVPDEATSMLMQQFYSHLNDGHNHAEALRKAMLDTRVHYPNPEQWGAFSLMSQPPRIISSKPDDF